MWNMSLKLIVLQVLPFSAAKIVLTAQRFELAGGTTTNVKLSWFNGSRVKQYSINRQVNGGQSQLIATVSGNTYDDYQTQSGQLTYSISSGEDGPDSSDIVMISTKPPLASQYFSIFDNVQESSFRTKSKIKLKDKYYQYSVQKDEGGTSKIVEAVSSDGFSFSAVTRVVLPGPVVCAAKTDGCKLEAVTFLQNPKTLEVVMWGHWENRIDYKEARVAVAFGMPGGTWQFGGAFRPLGHDSRDLTFYIDDDGAGYLVSSTSVNTDMNIYKLSADLHQVASLVATVLKGKRREAPSLIKHEGFYYLFTSLSASWYPSAGQYISSTKLTGPWSESRNVGNLSGFGAQSGGVQKLGSTFVMCANQWKGQWLDPEPPNRQIILPISLKSGWAQYYFYSRLTYLDDDKQGGVFGIQSGKVLRAISSSTFGTSLLSSESSVSFLSSTNINLDLSSHFQLPCVPYNHSVDLGDSYVITQIDLTTRLVSGSESAFQFKITASKDISDKQDLIVDGSSNTRVGFVTRPVESSKGIYRRVTLHVMKVTNVQNKHEANWNAGIQQFTIYGMPAQTSLAAN